MNYTAEEMEKVIAEFENGKPLPWQYHLAAAIKAMLATEPYCVGISPSHTKDTPIRVARTFEEFFSGCFVDVKALLTCSLFENNNEDSQMIHVREHTWFSICAHHLVIIRGTAHFAYIPDAYIIGLSKIPRLVDAFARRPQVQENMTRQIVDSFMEYVKPKGCAVMLSADHACMQCRGVESENAVTDTTALRGCFMNELTRHEFLLSALQRSRK